MPSFDIVYTDGACRGNPGPGGWAWVQPDRRFASGAEPATTNQRMELTAALEATRSLEGPLEVVSDSTYVVNCFRDRWWEGWQRRGWVNANRRPVANRDLWEPLIEVVRARPVVFRWVKGHGTDPWNDLADRLATQAAGTGEGRVGTSPPDDPGPADAGPRAAATHAPPGRLLAVLGHRPPELGGYGENDLAGILRRRLGEILAAKLVLHPDLVVLTGLTLGAETLAAEAAREVSVPYVVVLPYPNPDRMWPEASRRRFAALLASSSERVLLQKAEPGTRRQAGAALGRRDAWLRRVASEALVVWDGKDDLIGRRVRSFQDDLGEEEVWILDPAELG